MGFFRQTECRVLSRFNVVGTLPLMFSPDKSVRSMIWRRL
jgi:hypothetical protein